MDTVAEIAVEVLKFVTPALFGLLGIKLVLDHQRKKDRQGQFDKIATTTLKETLPLRLSAYERVILFLERIKPPQLVGRVAPHPEQTPAQYQLALIASIREEFEHNIAQQVYISHQAWVGVMLARDETIAMLRAICQAMPEGASVRQYQEAILKHCNDPKDIPSYKAIFMLKGEVSRILIPQAQAQ
ncbi:hypothetical protein [Pontibacter sp. G13]|uniref:DUF7935 family protein n=1 Tax=Pontibacter sp. G13 TaxID=3074898 RepID=UPI00288AA42D|nr:hypothetical protein [Pontibacter sp. G13]WNJ18849.1 hypothetical protein RJD25_28680 [Pontibacter sp. G13]